MTIRNRIAVLVGGGILVAAGWATAQALRPQSQPNPTVLSGGDVGFRIESYDGSTPVGKLVVKIDGQWVEVRLSGLGVKKLTTR